MREETTAKTLYDDASANFFTSNVEDVCKLLKSGKMRFTFEYSEIVWTRDHIIAYLNNMIFGNTPISPIAINIESLNSFSYDLTEEISKKPFEDTTNIQYAVIDGRQRIQLYFKSYTNNPDFANIVLDLSLYRFKIMSDMEKNSIPIGIIFNENESVFTSYISKKTDSQVELLKAVRNRFFKHTIMVMFANNLFRDQQLKWFTELNNAGSSMTGADMLLFKLDAKDNTLKPYESYILPYNNLISNYGFDYLVSSSKAKISYPLTALNPLIELMFRVGHKNNYTPIPSDVKISIIDSIHPNDLRTMFADSLIALNWTLEFLKKIEIIPTRMEYITFISGFYILRNPTENAYNVLKTWCEETIFTDTTNTEKRQIYSNLLSAGKNL